MTRYLYAEAPDGTVVRRRTDRDYSHAVLVNGRNGWSAWSFNGRYDLAYKASNQARAHGYRPVIVPVAEVKP